MRSVYMRLDQRVSVDSDFDLLLTFVFSVIYYREELGYSILYLQLFILMYIARLFCFRLLRVG